MAQLDDLQAYVNFELPRRIVLLTVANTSYDGDPNDGAAPDIIDNAPLGTQYNQETPDTMWRKDSLGAWVEVGGVATHEGDGLNSLVLGTGADADGATSIAFGFGTTVSVAGANSVAIGDGIAITAAGATAVGTLTQAGVNGAAYGNFARATGGSSLAAGLNSLASAGNTVSLGFSSLADAASAVAVGDNSTASGARSLSFGDTSTVGAGGDDSIALGTLATVSASAANAVSLGDNTSVTASFGTAVGSGSSAGSNGSAFGVNAAATGVNSFAAGRNSNALSSNSIAVGNASSIAAGGTAGIALGVNSSVAAPSAAAIGKDASVNTGSSDSMAFGRASDVSSPSSVAFGPDAIVPLVSAVVSGGTITAIVGANLVDGETIVLNDGVNPAVTLEFDDDASVVETPTLRQIAFTGADADTVVASAIQTAINNAPTLDITASITASPQVDLDNDTAGTVGNKAITHTVADAGFIVTGMLGGLDQPAVALGASATVAGPGEMRLGSVGNVLNPYYLGFTAYSELSIGPASEAGYGKLYAKADGAPYWLDSSGAESSLLGLGGPSVSTINALPRWGDTVGSSLLDSGVTVDGSDNLVIPVAGSVSHPGSAGATEVFGAGSSATTSGGTVFGDASTVTGTGGVSVGAGNTVGSGIAIGQALTVGLRGIGIRGSAETDTVNIGGTATGQQGTCIGSSASTSGTGVAVGHLASSGSGGVSLGKQSAATGTAVCAGFLASGPDASVVMGRQAKVNATATQGVSVGAFSDVLAAHTYSIALGASAQSTAANRCTIGTIAGAFDLELQVGAGFAAWGSTPPAAQPTYTITNDTTDRTIDANSTTLNELADFVCTMAKDLQATGLYG